MKQSTYIAIILVLILILIGQWFVNHERDNEQNLANDKHREKIKTLQAEITDSKANTDSLKKLIPIIEQKNIVNQAQVERPIHRLKERIAENRPEVMQEIDSMAIVKAFVGDLDSLNAAQEHKTEVVKAGCLEEIANRDKIIIQQDTTINKQDSVIFIQNSLIDDQKKLIKRAKRKEKVLKVLIPVGVVLGVLIAI